MSHNLFTRYQAAKDFAMGCLVFVLVVPLMYVLEGHEHE